jgi:hypothetical protein
MNDDPGNDSDSRGLDPAVTRELLVRYVTAQIQRAERAEVIGDVETWEDASDGSRDGVTALMLVDAKLW